MINIIGVGDIMPGGILSGVEQGYVSEDILELLSSADIRVGTLETAIGNAPSFYEEKMSRKADVIYALDKDLSKLLLLNINIVSLANNHFFDLGPEGAQHTIELLNQLGIEHIGAGRNIEEASRAIIKHINGGRVAFIAFCDWRDETVGWCPFATDSTPGVNPMFEEHVVAEIKKYKSYCDYVVVMPHWGKEHTYVTTDQVVKMAKLMMNTGADLILGSHPHRVQPVVNYKKSSVAFSMGNFLFPNRLIVPPRSTYYSEQQIIIQKLPFTDHYPFVDELTYKKWKPLAMTGMIVCSQLAPKRTLSTYKLTQMAEDGHISLCDNPKVVNTLRWWGNVIKYTPYGLIYFMLRAIKSIIFRSKRLFSKIAHLK